MPLKDYTTTVAVHRSAGEITAALVKSGARGVAQEYDDEGHVTGLEFAIPVSGEMLRYALPVRANAVWTVLKGQKVQPRYLERDHVEKVAWRIMRDWVLAQPAIIETQMVSLPQVMLPYMRTDDGTTVYARFESTRALPSGNSR